MIFLRLVLAVAAGFVLPGVSAQLAKDSAPPAEAQRDEQKSLAALDVAIGRFSAVVDRVPDVNYKATNQEYLTDFTKRCQALRKKYDAVALSDLKIDLNIESQRLATWLVTQSMRMPVANAERAADLTIYLSPPSLGSKVEVKAALDAVDREIQRLERRKNAMSAGPDRTEREVRIQGIKKRRAELEAQLTSDGWVALISDLKRQWANEVR